MAGWIGWKKSVDEEGMESHLPCKVLRSLTACSVTHVNKSLIVTWLNATSSLLFLFSISRIIFWLFVVVFVCSTSNLYSVVSGKFSFTPNSIFLFFNLCYLSLFFVIQHYYFLLIYILCYLSLFFVIYLYSLLSIFILCYLSLFFVIYIYSLLSIFILCYLSLFFVIYFSLLFIIIFCYLSLIVFLLSLFFVIYCFFSLVLSFFVINFHS